MNDDWKIAFEAQGNKLQQCVFCDLSFIAMRRVSVLILLYGLKMYLAARPMHEHAMHDKTHGAHHAHAEHVTQHGGVHVHEVKGHHAGHHQATKHHAYHAGDDPRGRFKRGGKANGGGRAGEDCDKKCTKVTWEFSVGWAPTYLLLMKL